MIKIDVGGMTSESDVNKLNAILMESISGVKMADAVLKKQKETGGIYHYR